MKTLVLVCGLTCSALAETTFIDSGSPNDQFFTGGTPLTISSTLPGIPPGADLTVRYGSFRYQIPCTDQLYRVSLAFMESNVRAANLRVFSVRLNDQLILDKMDIFAAAGFGVPIIRRFVTGCAEGKMNLIFTTITKSATVSSIELTALADLYPAPPPPPPPPPPPAATLPTVTEWASCQSGEVLAGPIGPGVPPGSMWPGVKKQDTGYAYSCDGLEFYRFKLADGTIAGPYVAVKMPDDFAIDPALWVEHQ